MEEIEMKFELHAKRRYSYGYVWWLKLFSLRRKLKMFSHFKN